MPDQSDIRKMLSGAFRVLRDELLPKDGDPLPYTPKSFLGRVAQSAIALGADVLAKSVGTIKCQICNTVATHRFAVHVTTKGRKEYLYLCEACVKDCPEKVGWEELETVSK
jgi:hypothetical protein